MERVRLGLVGANRQGREHLVDAAGVDIVAACDVSETVRTALGHDHPELGCYTTVTEMLEKERLNGLVVAVPHHVVPEIWPELLAGRLPILKEKPLGRNLTEAFRLLADARAAGVPVVTAVQRRTHPSYEHLRAIVATERITNLAATLHLGFAPERASLGWRANRDMAGGGALLDSGYHMVDLAQSLVGPITVIHANLWTFDRPAGPDDLETDAIVTGRAGRTWVRLECRVGGRPDPSRLGGFVKFEHVAVDTDSVRYAADRRGVWKDEVMVFSCHSSWRDGMDAQLQRFAHMIRTKAFDADVVWDQVAAMRVIHEAYGDRGRFGDLPPWRAT